jgi:hypothetical protein
LHTVYIEKLIDKDHSARSIWQLVARLDLSLYHAGIAVLKGALAATMQRRSC